MKKAVENELYGLSYVLSVLLWENEPVSLSRTNGQVQCVAAAAIL